MVRILATFGVVLIAGGSPGCGGDASTHRSGPAEDIAVRIIADCDPCSTVRFDTVASLGSRSDAELLGFGTRIVRGPGIGYVAGGEFTPGRVLIFDSTGGRLRDVLGREGGGPGEFIAPRPAVGPGGGVWIVDPGNLRITELVPPGLLGGAFRFTGDIDETIPVDSAHVLASGIIMSSGSAPRPLNVLNGRGEIVRSFGEWTMRGTRVAPDIATDPDGGFWTLDPNRYRLTHRSLAGEVLEILEREPSWFRDWDEAVSPVDVLSDLRVDSAGRLWVSGLVWVIEEWEPLGLNDLARIERIRDEVVEVIDPDRRQVIARRRFGDPWIREVHGSDLLMSLRQTADGYVFVDLLRPRLE